MIRDVHRESEKEGLKRNTNKSVIITNGPHMKITIQKDLQPIQCK